MKLSTMTIPTVEMTVEERNKLENVLPYRQRILGAKVEYWNYDTDEIRLNGETFFRKIVVN